MRIRVVVGMCLVLGSCSTGLKESETVAHQFFASVQNQNTREIKKLCSQALFDQSPWAEFQLTLKNIWNTGGRLKNYHRRGFRTHKGYYEGRLGTHVFLTYETQYEKDEALEILYFFKSGSDDFKLVGYNFQFKSIKEFVESPAQLAEPGL